MLAVSAILPDLAILVSYLQFCFLDSRVAAYWIPAGLSLDGLWKTESPRTGFNLSCVLGAWWGELDTMRGP